MSADKNIYFDASDLRGKSVDQVVDLIGKLSKAGGFEDTLSYVYLPVLSSVYEKADASRFDGRRYGANERRQRGRTANENQATGRSALISVFDKLASVNVRTILRLHVDDRDNLSHSDAAIERAVRGRDFFSLGHSRNEPIHVEHWYADPTCWNMHDDNSVANPKSNGRQGLEETRPKLGRHCLRSAPRGACSSLLEWKPGSS